MSTSSSPPALHTAVLDRGGRVAQVGWRFATASDLYNFFGERQRETVKAIVGLVDGEVCGVIGIAREAWTARFFSDCNDRLYPYLNSVLIMRGIKKALQFVQDYPTAVYAKAQQDEGARILSRLGFEETDEKGVFVWPI